MKNPIKAPVYESKTIDNIASVLPRTIFVGSALIYVSYIILFFGLFSINSQYINYLHASIQLIISVFLIIRFHPFRKHILEPTDSAVIFSGSVFLLTSLGLTQYLYYVTNRTVKKYTNIDLPNIKDSSQTNSSIVSAPTNQSIHFGNLI